MRTANPNNFVYTARAALPGVGRLLLAGSWLLAIGILDVVYAISVIAGPEIFITNASVLFSLFTTFGERRPSFTPVT